MSIFKKIFGGGGKSGSAKKEFIPRPPRVRISPLHRVIFHRAKDGMREPVELGNISTHGMGLLRAHASDARSGMKLAGELEINQKGFVIESEVVHESEHILGCQFAGPPVDLTQAIEDYFRLEILGLSLSQVDAAYLKQDPAGRVSWFTDGRQNEIYFVTDDQGILNFHLSFLGNYIEGGRAKALRAGHIIDDAPFGSSKHKGSSMLDLSNSVSLEILQMGRLLIDNVEKLPPEHITALTKLLTKS